MTGTTADSAETAATFLAGWNTGCPVGATQGWNLLPSRRAARHRGRFECRARFLLLAGHSFLDRGAHGREELLYRAAGNQADQTDLPELSERRQLSHPVEGADQEKGDSARSGRRGQKTFCQRALLHGAHG